MPVIGNKVFFCAILSLNILGIIQDDDNERRGRPLMWHGNGGLLVSQLKDTTNTKSENTMKYVRKGYSPRNSMYSGKN